jgi:hypothetical protein
VLRAYPPCKAPSGLVTRAKSVKALPASGKTHDDTRAFPDVSNVPWPMSNGEDDETTPDTSVRNMETAVLALVVSYGTTRNTTDAVGANRNADEMDIDVTVVGYT